jgi:hypothetical protein
MKHALKLFALSLALVCVSPSVADAGGGLLSRLRTVDRAVPTSRPEYRPATTHAYQLRTRRGSSVRSRLPSGRSYYQGRYYGNLNNRFYGPQYGYF